MLLKSTGIKHTRAYQGMARVYFLENQKKAAYDEMTKLIEKAKNNVSAYEKQSEYGERDLAKSDPNMGTKLDPLRTYPYRYRAAVLMDGGKKEEVISKLSQGQYLSNQIFSYFISVKLSTTQWETQRLPCETARQHFVLNQMMLIPLRCTIELGLLALTNRARIKYQEYGLDTIQVIKPDDDQEKKKQK